MKTVFNIWNNIGQRQAWVQLMACNTGIIRWNTIDDFNFGSCCVIWVQLIKICVSISSLQLKKKRDHAYFPYHMLHKIWVMWSSSWTPAGLRAMIYLERIDRHILTSLSQSNKYVAQCWFWFEISGEIPYIINYQTIQRFWLDKESDIVESCFVFT